MGPPKSSSARRGSWWVFFSSGGREDDSCPPLVLVPPHFAPARLPWLWAQPSTCCRLARCSKLVWQSGAGMGLGWPVSAAWAANSTNCWRNGRLPRTAPHSGAHPAPLPPSPPLSPVLVPPPPPPVVMLSPSLVCAVTKCPQGDSATEHHFQHTLIPVLAPLPTCLVPAATRPAPPPRCPSSGF